MIHTARQTACRGYFYTLFHPHVPLHPDVLPGRGRDEGVLRYTQFGG